MAKDILNKWYSLEIIRKAQLVIVLTHYTLEYVKGCYKFDKSETPETISKSWCLELKKFLFILSIQSMNFEYLTSNCII